MSIRCAIALLLLSQSSAAVAATELDYVGGRLSARIDGEPLASVLAAVEARTGVQVKFIDRKARASQVNATFENLPLEQALRRILKDLSYVYSERHSARVVLVLASAATRNLAELPDDPALSDAVENADVKLAIAGLSAADLATQLIATIQLAGSQQSEAVHALLKAAGTAGVEVRVEAATALAQSALVSPEVDTPAIDALRQLAESDEPSVRQVALTTLKDIETRRGTLAIAPLD